MVVMIRIRAAFWELVAIGLAILGGISSIINIVRTIYSYRRIVRRIGETIRKAVFPILIASLIGIILYLRNLVNPSTLVNFPPGAASPFPHLSLYASALLDNFTYSFLGALAFSIVYSLRYRLERFSWVGSLSRRIMMVLLLFYPGLVLWFSVSAEISFLIPSWAQTPLWLGSAYPLSLIVFRSVETVIGRRIFGKQGLLNIAVNKALGVASVGMRSIGEGVYGNVRYVSSRITGQPLEVVPHPNVKPTIASLLTILAILSMTVAYELGYTSMLELFYAFGVAPYALAIASGVVGWRKLKSQEEEKKRVVRVPRRLWMKFKFLASTIHNLFSTREQ